MKGITKFFIHDLSTNSITYFPDSYWLCIKDNDNQKCRNYDNNAKQQQQKKSKFQQEEKSDIEVVSVAWN